MKESKAVAIIVTILVILGILNIIYFSLWSGGFNFSKSEITINGNNIQENLLFHTNKEYHTLFRNFITQITVEDNNIENIKINSLSCQSGIPYVLTSYGFYTFNQSFLSSPHLPYTENNEYGCTFGNELGFKDNQDYYIKSSYTINNENLFEINGRYYTKFVAYSPNNHKLLIKGNNFIISGDVITKGIFFPNEYVILYLPYDNQNISSFNIIQKTNFEFDNNQLIIIFIFLISFLPALLFFFVWFIFGRETSYLDVPKELSMYPNERKAWEVAAIFNPPFGKMGLNFFPTMIMDFYRRKIIDIKTINKEVYIKLLKHDNKNLDQVDLAFISYIEKIIELGDKSKIDSQGFFKIEKMVNSIGFSKKFDLQKESRSLSKKVNQKTKEYLDNKGQIIINTAMFLSFFLSYLIYTFFNFNILSTVIFQLISAVLISLISGLSSIFIKFKKDYYIEYQKWQSFKHYLKAFSTMKTCPPEAIKLWQQHLVYATALGVGSVVIKKFKEWKIIDQKQYNTFYNTSVYSSSNFGSAASGGMGGAGGGGAGGGGGGGR